MSARDSKADRCSLTMRLKDKLHPPKVKSPVERIKRTQSQRACVQPDVSSTHKHRKPVLLLADQERAVVSALRYFQTLVDKLWVADLRGAAADRRAAGVDLLCGATGQILEATRDLVQAAESETVSSSCLSDLYGSVAQLIGWTDQLTVRHTAHDDDEVSMATVTAAIQTARDAVKELVRLANGTPRGLAPSSPGLLDATSAEVPANEGTEPSRQNLPSEEVPAPPPKPPKPLPLLNMQTDKPLPLLNMQTDKPLPLPNRVPALPPKKRHSMIGSSPYKVTVVTPMGRVEEAECLKYNSGDMLCSETHDNGFLHKDDEMLPPPLPPPPALPQKRRSAQGIVNSQTTPPGGDDPAPLHRSPSHQAFDERLHVSSPPSPSASPPPLPEKKHHIHEYLQFMSTSSSSASDMFFYQRCSQSSHKGAYPPTVYQLTHHDLPTVPCLPPKKRPLVSRAEDGVDITKESSHPDQRGSEEHKDEDDDEEDEDGGVLLMDQQDVLDRLTLKTEEEEGPDVKAGSPDVLLVHATEIDSNDQRLYCEAFLSTYRSFISPYDVISKLQHRYRHLCKGIEPVNRRASKNTFLVLVRVVDEICAVELDCDLQVLLMELVFRLVIGGELALACLLRANFLSKMVQRRKLIGSPLSLRPLSAMGVAARPGTLSDFSSKDVAEQLTLLDSELFYKIELPEVLLWSKEQNEEKCPNLTEFTQHFNSVSFWVRSVVILQDRQTDREKLLLKFIKVMKHLRKLNNFNSYLCVLSALDSAPLSRLDWQRSTAEALEEYSSLIDSSSSFRNYRTALAEVEPPCIPYLGLILQDLTFVHLGNPDQVMTSQGSKVNFSKRWQQFNILDTVRSFQQTRYSLCRNEDIVSFFNGFSDHLAEEALWELSLRIRPRNTPRANQR